MDLSGTWAFQLDPDDHGITDAWFNHKFAKRITLPGSLQAQGYGEEISVDTAWVGDIVDRSWFTEPRYARYRQPGNVKVPFWLQPARHYNGVAWYQREVTVPPEWAGQRVTLTLELPHWETRVWLDGRAIGANDGLGTPHVYDLGTAVAPGPHRLTIRVDNRMIVDVGPNSHSITDHSQTNWNGIVGRIELAAGSPVWISNIQVYPDLARSAARVRVSLRTADASFAGTGWQLTLQARLYNSPLAHEPAPVTVDVNLASDGAALEVDYPLGEGAQPWDEFNPALYALAVELRPRGDGAAAALPVDRRPRPEGQAPAGALPVDRRTVTFGLREVGVIGTQLAINGRPIFIRGTLEFCLFPLTGYPSTDVEAWKHIIRVCQAHGLNQMRCHSWCPPEAAFIAADELGFYLQVECSSWANQGAALGEGRPLDTWLYAEGHRITQAYGNHPSFIMMAYGNEPAGNFREYLAEWVTYWRARDSRRLYTGAAGWPAIPENQYHNIPEPRIQRWGEELRSRINALPPETLTDYTDYVRQAGAPIVSHEIGQWCVYPNFAEIAKYTGFLKARSYEIFRDTLEANGMGDQAHDFLMASGKLQALCYKEEIEAALRTPGFAGFHLLGLNDFTGQGTALVGVVDAFWDNKGYIAPEAFRRFCNTTVPLARLAKRVWQQDEPFSAEIDVAHFGPAPLANAVADWKLVDERGAAVAHGTLPPATIPIGNGTRLGTVTLSLANLPPAHRYTLVVSLAGTPFENDWDIWVFAQTASAASLSAAPDDVLITRVLDAAALDRLAAGGKVLYMPPPEQVATEAQIGFSSIFWNTAWTHNQAPHTLGILCDPAHPVFAGFPTEYHTNWQWWELIHGAAAMILDRLPRGLRPLVQPIDTWFENRRLGLLIEARVRGGKLVVCSMDLTTDLPHRPVARQLRYSLLRYMAGATFDPQVKVDVAAVRRLVKG